MVAAAKKLRTLPVACSDSDLAIVDECRKLQTAFPPSRSEIALLLIRDGAGRLLQGETSLETIYQKNAAGQTAQAEETAR